MLRKVLSSFGECIRFVHFERILAHRSAAVVVKCVGGGSAIYVGCQMPHIGLTCIRVLQYKYDSVQYMACMNV